jgi:ABC-type lipoprotein export system ATPase subunit
MKKIELAFSNCHGIRELAATLDYRRSPSAAIYAPNGTMKTSFARTFQDLVTGSDTRDNVFPDRLTERRIVDETGASINPDDVVVILSYDEELGPTEQTSTLLVNAALRKEYEGLQVELLRVRDELGTALKTQAKTRQDVYSNVSRTFTKEPDSFFTAMTRIYDELVAQDESPFTDVPYDVIFNDKVLPLLRKPEFQDALSDYVTRLNELLDESRFFDRKSFSYYNATNVTKSLGDNGFFTARHALLLRGGEGEPVEVQNSADLDSLINGEKKKISDDAALTKKLEAVEKALNRNIDTRSFYGYISEHVELLPELRNIDLFEERVWKSYLKTHQVLYEQVVAGFRKSEARKREIEQEAASQSTQWENVIRIFNDRFFVPFRLTAQNRNQVVLGQEKVLRLGFEFEEGAEHVGVERADLLKVLSNGEKKALYILNVLFEVEARKTSARDTLFVIDDLADSFDYKNKYAIIHYLKEMSQQDKFKLLILTHNFDFFRTLESRGVVRYDGCLMAQRTDEKVILAKAQGVKNPFIKDFKPNFFENRMKRIASIPFIRNIAEYTKGEQDVDYLRLTSLLHWKPETATIKQGELDAMFKRIFSVEGAWASPDESVVDLILAEADVALSAPEGINFEHKIVLSLAIRLRAEQHMIVAVNDSAATDAIDSNQTHRLYELYDKLGRDNSISKDILDAVVLMTPENIHVNSFMYEPIIDMSDSHLRKLYADVLTLESSDPTHA